MTSVPEVGDQPEARPDSRALRKRLMILTLAHATTHIRGAVLPLVYPLVMSSMRFGYVELGAMLSVTRLIGGLLQGIWGYVARYVPGKWIIVGEQVGVGVGTGLVGVSHTYPVLVGSVTVGQVAASPHHPLASSMLSRWFSKARGTALSLHFAGANVATVVSPLIATLLLLHWDWRVTLDIFAVPCLAVAVLVTLVLPVEPGEIRRQERRAAPGQREAGRPGFFEPLRDPLVRRLILTASVTAGGKGVGILQNLLPLLLMRGMHLSTVLSGLVFSAFTATSVVGPVAAGWLSDRIPRPRLLSGLLGVSAAAGVATAMLFARWGLFLLVPLLVVFGLAVYGCSPIEQAIIGDLTEGTISAQAYSLFYSLTSGAGAGWPLFLGWILARWGFTATFLVIAGTYIVGMIVYGTRDWTPRASGADAGAP